MSEIAMSADFLSHLVGRKKESVEKVDEKVEEKVDEVVDEKVDEIVDDENKEEE